MNWREDPVTEKQKRMIGTLNKLLGEDCKMPPTKGQASDLIGELGRKLVAGKTKVVRGGIIRPNSDIRTLTDRLAHPRGDGAQMAHERDMSLMEMDDEEYF